MIIGVVKIVERIKVVGIGKIIGIIEFIQVIAEGIAPGTAD